MHLVSLLSLVDLFSTICTDLMTSLNRDDSKVLQQSSLEIIRDGTMVFDTRSFK